MTRNPKIRRALFAAAVLGSLGFGASQAIAAPSNPAAQDARFCGPDCEWRNYFCVCW